MKFAPDRSSRGIGKKGGEKEVKKKRRVCVIGKCEEIDPKEKGCECQIRQVNCV